MSPRKTQTFGLAVVAALLGVLLIATPATASVTGTAQSSSAAVAEESLNQTFNDTAVTTATRTADGGVLLGGTSGFERGNATLTKLTANGTEAWTRSYDTTNRSGIVAVERGPGDEIYFLQYAYERSESGYGGYSMWLVGATETGEVEWRQSLDRSGFYAAGDALAVGDEGPAIATRGATGSNVSLLQFGSDGDLRWNRTYHVDASPQTLTRTDDGYLMAGTAGFQHPWVLRTDADGVVTANRTYESIEVMRLVGAVPTDGGVLVAGTYSANHRGQHPWAAKLGTDGVPRWSRVYPQAADVQVQSVVADADGLALVGTGRMGRASDASGHLVGVGPDGSQRYTKRVDGSMVTVAVPGPDRQVTLAGLRGYPSRNVTSTVQTVTLPAATDEQDRRPNEPLTSGRTHYRGQDLEVVRPSAANETIDVVAVPGEYDDFEPHVVRRLELDGDGRAVVESATLESGQYYLRTSDGTPVRSLRGWALQESDRDGALFEIESQRLYNRESTQLSVDRAAGESTVTTTIESDRPEYALYVSVDRFRGDQVGAETLRELFADESVSIEQFRGTTVARLPADGTENVTLTTDGVDAGLYDLTFRGVDTGDAGTVLEQRLVVGMETARPVSVSLGTDSLTVGIDDEVGTNVTVEGATAGIGALSMSANRSGAPAIGLSTDLNINATSAQSGSMWSDDRAETDAQAFDGDTANGTVVVGSLSARTSSMELDPDSESTSTVTFRLDWVVDEDGVPYTVPEETTLTVDVENIENATGEYRGRRGYGSASESGSVRAP